MLHWEELERKMRPQWLLYRPLKWSSFCKKNAIFSSISEISRKENTDFHTGEDFWIVWVKPEGRWHDIAGHYASRTLSLGNVYSVYQELWLWIYLNPGCLGLSLPCELLVVNSVHRDEWKLWFEVFNIWGNTTLVVVLVCSRILRINPVRTAYVAEAMSKSCRMCRMRSHQLMVLVGRSKKLWMGTEVYKKGSCKLVCALCSVHKLQVVVCWNGKVKMKQNSKFLCFLMISFVQLCILMPSIWSTFVFFGDDLFCVLMAISWCLFLQILYFLVILRKCICALFLEHQ